MAVHYTHTHTVSRSKEHQVKDTHSCSRSQTPSTDTSSSTVYQSYKCSVTTCDRSELVPVPCDSCHLNFCMLHRHAADHSCSQQVVRSRYMGTTAEHVQAIADGKVRPNTPARKTPKSKKAMEMAAKVTLMKLKQTSKGDAGIPMDSRIYVNVQLSTTDTKKSSAHWLDQEWSVGRTIDYISDKDSVTNNNNRANCPMLRLRSWGGDVYHMESTLKDLLSEGSLYSGSTVELCYVTDT